MAKPQTGTPQPKAAQHPAPSKRPAASEIDDIFSKKQKLDPAPPPPAADASGKKKKKEKAKAPVIESAPAPGPVTIVDTSASIERYKNAPAPLVRKRKADAGDEEGQKGDEAEESFMDSRGTNRAFMLLSARARRSAWEQS